MRGGSRGVKNKNIKLINNRPLLYYTIKQAIKSKIFDHIVVSTDSKKILKIAKSYGADDWFLRPKKLSLNTSPKIPVIRHALFQAEKYYNSKIIMTCCTTFLKNKGLCRLNIQKYEIKYNKSEYYKLCLEILKDNKYKTNI